MAAQTQAKAADAGEHLRDADDLALLRIWFHGKPPDPGWSEGLFAKPQMNLTDPTHIGDIGA